MSEFLSIVRWDSLLLACEQLYGKMDFDDFNIFVLEEI